MEELGNNIFKCDCGELFYSLENFIMHIECKQCDSISNDTMRFYFYYVAKRFYNALKEDLKVKDLVGTLKNKICKN